MTGPDDRTHDDMRARFDDYARGRLDDWQRAVIEQHLFWCLPCRTELRTMLERDQPSP